MSQTEPGGWRRVSPLSVLFYIGQILRGVARNLFQAVVPATVFVVSTGWTTEDRLYTLAVALLAVLVLVAVGRWLRFRFRVDDDGVRIRQGIFQREELDIGYDRIQGINATQNPIYRMFGLVDVKLDTAGSATAEGHLPAVAADLGDALRGRIRRRREETGTEARSGDAPEADSRDGEPAETLLRLSAGDMVRIGLTSNRALLLLAVLAPVADQLDERVGEWLQRTLTPVAESLEGLSAGAAAGMAVASIVAFAAVLMGISILGAFLRHHGYTLTTDGEVLRSRGGLLTTHEHSMGLGKLQVLRIRQGPLLRLFGAFRLVAKQAASHAVNTSKSFLIPLAPPAFPERAPAIFFGDEGRDLELDMDGDAFHPISRRYVRSRTLVFGGLGTPIATLLLAGHGAWPLAALTLLLLPVATWLAVRRRHARWGLALTADAAVVRQGFVGTTLQVFLLRKVQRVDIVQSPFQRRHGLVTMQFVLAAETVTVPWIDEAVARRLCDRVLYKIESSRLAWL